MVNILTENGKSDNKSPTMTQHFIHLISSMKQNFYSFLKIKSIISNS